MAGQIGAKALSYHTFRRHKPRHRRPLAEPEFQHRHAAGPQKTGNIGPESPIGIQPVRAAVQRAARFKFRDFRLQPAISPAGM